jgi:putative PIN family toxin of toxin-antitoxin system
VAALLRIVLDTNVYISAALRGGLAETALNLAAAGRLEVVTSPAILSELEEKLRDKLRWESHQVETFLSAVRGISTLVQPEVSLAVVADDEDDNRILECAVQGEAMLIVTFDQDLLRLRRYRSIGIVSPQELLYYGLAE